MRKKLKLIKQTVCSSQGFTLVELIIVIAILTLLGTLAVTQYGGILQKAKTDAARAEIKIFENQLKIYYASYGQYPATEEGLQALITAKLLEDSKNALNDPWGNPYNYRYPGNFSDKPDIWSYGSDGKEGGEGDAADIVNWE
jgi:general secretion pathway protein G